VYANGTLGSEDLQYIFLFLFLFYYFFVIFLPGFVLSGVPVTTTTTTTTTT